MALFSTNFFWGGDVAVVGSQGRSGRTNARSFIILLSGGGLTSFSINNRLTFFREKKVK